jgi:hypothetical protein
MKRKVSARANFVSSGTEQHHQPAANLGKVETWRDDLRDMATVTLEMLENIGGNERERDDLNRASDSLRSIDELVKIIGELPYTHAQAHALGQLWAVIGAAFVIGSRAVKNPVSGKVGTAPGRSRVAENHAPQLELITKLITTAEKDCPPGRGHATAVDNQVRVEMKKLGYDVCEETVSRRRRKMVTR